jgi:hypothetical protein
MHQVNEICTAAPVFQLQCNVIYRCAFISQRLLVNETGSFSLKAESEREKVEGTAKGNWIYSDTAIT